MLAVVAISLSAVGCVDALAGAPVFVREFLEPYATEGFVCRGPSVDVSGMGQWVCTKVRDQVAYQLVVDGDVNEIRQITAAVDQTEAATSDKQLVLDFFSMAVSRELGPDAGPVRQWMTASGFDGGQQRFGRLIATCDPFGVQTRFALFRQP